MKIYRKGHNPVKLPDKLAERLLAKGTFIASEEQPEKHVKKPAKKVTKKTVKKPAKKK